MIANVITQLMAAATIGANIQITATDSGVRQLRAFASAQPPMVAVWCEDMGWFSGKRPPYLRIAIWEDGRVIFAKDPNKWDQKLRQGRIPSDRVAALKKQITAAGVFELTGTAYLVPDAHIYCMLVNFGGKQSLLEWDEVESPNYGINIDPTPKHLKFKSAWKTVNRLALAVRPGESHPFPHPFNRVPQSWKKQAIKTSD